MHGETPQKRAQLWANDEIERRRNAEKSTAFGARRNAEKSTVWCTTKGRKEHDLLPGETQKRAQYCTTKRRKEHDSAQDEEIEQHCTKRHVKIEAFLAQKTVLKIVLFPSISFQKHK